MTLDELPRPLRILSDLHLGHPWSDIPTVAALRPLWLGAGTLLLNGDSIEPHYPQARREASSWWAELEEAVRADGVQLVPLTGNHDPDVSPHGWAAAAGGALLVLHGDILLPNLAPWSLDAPRLARFLAEARTELSGGAYADELEREIAIARAGLRRLFRCPAGHDGAETTWSRRWSWYAALPRKVAIAVKVWTGTPGLARAFAARHRPAARVVVIGHTHHAGVWTSKGRTVINTGAFHHGFRRLLVEWNGDVLSVHRVRREGAQFAFREVVATLKTSRLDS